MKIILLGTLTLTAAAAAAGVVQQVAYDGKPEAFASFLASHQEPVLVRAEYAPTERFWGVRQLPFTLEHIAEYAPKTALLQAKNGSHERFPWACCKLRALYPEQLVARIKRAKEYIYFSAEMQKIPGDGAEFFTNAIMPKELLQVHEVQGEFKHLLWIGSKGVITPFHYDELHNVFLQVEGSKKFLLFPPTAWRQLYLYPKFHVRHRNAMLEYPPNEETLEEEFPAFKYFPVEPLEVEVNPGDVLYIPPLWFHQVEALSNSISVNVWSPVMDIEFYMTAWEQKLPLNYKKHSAEKAIRMTTFLIQKIVEYSLNLGPAAAEDFVRQTVESRYRRLNDEFMNVEEGEELSFDATVAASPNLFSDSLEMKEHKQYIESIRKDSPPILELDMGSALQLCSTYQKTNFKPKQLQGLKDAAQNIAKSFQRGSTGMREVFVANFIEDLSAQFVGENHVFSFMKYCVSSWLGEESSDKANVKDEL